MGGMKGYMRIVEVIITLVLLFSYSALVVSRNPPTPQSLKNTRILTRHSGDLKNMVCYSDRDRIRITKGLSLNPINNTLFQVTPHDLAYHMLVINPATGLVVDETGFVVPDLTDQEHITDVATASCVMTTAWSTRQVVMQVWYK